MARAAGDQVAGAALWAPQPFPPFLLLVTPRRRLSPNFEVFGSKLYKQRARAWEVFGAFS